MNIPNPITITPPSITKPDSTVQTFKPITLASLDVVFIDDPKRRAVVARIRPCPLTLALWKDDDYTAIGDWTQAQAEARIIELLGSDPAAALLNLFPRT